MIGSIVLATEQGLGYLAKSFYDNGIIDKVLIHEHSSRKNHREWYAGQSIVSSAEELLEQCDTLIFFETSFYPRILEEAKKRGKKTILMVMYECTMPALAKLADEIWSPSLLDQKYYPESKLVQIPVDVPWKLREKAKVFVHNAGNGGLGGRNGTAELIKAMEHVKSPIKLIIRSQIPIKIPDDSRMEVRIGTFDDIWSEGDVFIFPEKFNGLSLPIQEAFASGMLVMASARFPNTEYLPKEPLIPVSGFHKDRIAVQFDCAEFSPQTIASAIDSWYNKDITKFSLQGKEFNEKNSWKVLKEKYKELLSPSAEEEDFWVRT